MPGRPRDHELERRLLDAAWTLLHDDGYDAVTLSGVATRAGAHRTDLYRRWGSKAALITDALRAHLPPVAEVDTGSLRTDLRAFLTDLDRAWSAGWADGMIGLLADLGRDPRAERAFHAISDERAQPLIDALARAVRRGEVAEVPEPALIGNLLEGPLMHRRAFGTTPMSSQALDTIAAAVHAMLTGAPTRHQDAGRHE